MYISIYKKITYFYCNYVYWKSFMMINWVLHTFIWRIVTNYIENRYKSYQCSFGKYSLFSLSITREGGLGGTRGESSKSFPIQSSFFFKGLLRGSDLKFFLWLEPGCGYLSPLVFDPVFETDPFRFRIPLHAGYL